MTEIEGDLIKALAPGANDPSMSTNSLASVETGWKEIGSVKGEAWSAYIRQAAM